ncbi:MAG: tRNA (guanosine(46)-N7)-methyltransferase TrmB [Hyphomicrobiales bacterium]|nr:tRNA (guanosine(46)-N7)-methyltransferase TrmB [Hyphomicrobiales bacterium]
MALGERPIQALRRQLYGRSRGKPMRAGRERLLAEALPRMEIAPEALTRGRPFGFEPREIWLEIGFGSGEHLIEQAKAHPDVGFIGCEPFLNGIAAALAGVERDRLANVRLRRGDAESLLEAAPAAFFARVFLLYPDPWPKRRHHKRRLVSGTMVRTLARTMRPGGEFRFATDVDDYSGWTLRRFLASDDFRWRAARADDWRTPWPDWRPTRYETKARKEQRGPVYLTFIRV